MSLQHLMMTKNIIHPAVGVVFVNFILVVILLVMSVTVFATPAGIDLKFPSTGVSAREEGAVNIKVTSENVIYFNGKVVTLNELRRVLASFNYQNKVIMIKADRRASMGRITDIWDFCRGIPGVRVNVSTSN